MLRSAQYFFAFEAKIVTIHQNRAKHTQIFIVAGNVFETRMNVVHGMACNSPIHSNSVINYAITIRFKCISNSAA